MTSETGRPQTAQGSKVSNLSAIDWWKAQMRTYIERTFENGTLFYERTAGRYGLVPITATLFGIEGLDDFRLEFVVRDGRAVEVVGIGIDGQRDPAPRSK